MRGIGRQALQSAHDHSLDPGIRNGPRGARAGLVAQTVQAILDKTPAPLANGRLVHLKAGGNLLVLCALGAGKHDPSPQRERLSRIAADRQRTQLSAFRLTQHQIRQPPARHRPLQLAPESLTQRLKSAYCELQIQDTSVRQPFLGQGLRVIAASR